MGVTILITVINSILSEPFISTSYIVIPAAGASVSVLIIVSLLSKPDPDHKWEKFYTKEASLAEAIREQKQVK
jgi:solute:Na+ symporter, SSS family